MGVINDYGMPFTDQAGDRKYSSSQWREYFKQILSDGIVTGVSCKVNPQVAPNKTVYVASGSVAIQGAIRVVDTNTNLTCADNSSGNPRIDRVVARLNFTTRKIEFVIKQGTPAASPVAPTLTRDTNSWELALADITLANGYSTIVAGNISDKRVDESLCGGAKTIYMQTFDDENNLLKYNRDVTAVNAAGDPTEIQYKRPIDNSLFLKRVMSNPDANGNFTTVTEYLYQADGLSVYKTIVYTMTFLPNNLVDTMTRVVS